MNNICPQCSKPIDQPKTGRPKLYCSDKCRKDHHYAVHGKNHTLDDATNALEVLLTSANRLAIIKTGKPVLDAKLHQIAGDVKTSIQYQLPEVFIDE